MYDVKTLYYISFLLPYFVLLLLHLSFILMTLSPEFTVFLFFTLKSCPYFKEVENDRKKNFYILSIPGALYFLCRPEFPPVIIFHLPKEVPLIDIKVNIFW